MPQLRGITPGSCRRTVAVGPHARHARLKATAACSALIGPSLPADAASSVVALLLTPFPLFKRFWRLRPLPRFKRSVLVVQAEPAGRKPPLDETPHGSSLAPTVGIAGTRVAARVVDAGDEAAAHRGNCTSDLVAPPYLLPVPSSCDRQQSMAIGGKAERSGPPLPRLSHSDSAPECDGGDQRRRIEQSVQNHRRVEARGAPAQGGQDDAEQ